MGRPLYMRSIDQNIVMRQVTVINMVMSLYLFVGLMIPVVLLVLYEIYGDDLHGRMPSVSHVVNEHHSKVLCAGQSDARPCCSVLPPRRRQRLSPDWHLRRSHFMLEWTMRRTKRQWRGWNKVCKIIYKGICKAFPVHA